MRNHEISASTRFLWLRVGKRPLLTAARRLTREERDLIRTRIDEARRKAQKSGVGQAPPGLPLTIEEDVAAFLASKPELLFSMSEIGRALNYTPERIRRALAALQDQGRVTTVQVGRHYPRWKALPISSG